MREIREKQTLGGNTESRETFSQWAERQHELEGQIVSPVRGAWKLPGRTTNECQRMRIRGNVCHSTGSHSPL